MQVLLVNTEGGLTWLLFKYHSVGKDQPDPLCSIIQRIVAINHQEHAAAKLNFENRVKERRISIERNGTLERRVTSLERRPLSTHRMTTRRRSTTDPLPQPMGSNTRVLQNSQNDPIYEDPACAGPIVDTAYGYGYGEVGNVM